MFSISSEIITVTLTLAILPVCAVTDAISYRSPNALTFPAMLLGLCASLATAPTEAVFRLFLAVVLFYLGRLRIMGMGDLKLWMAVLFLRGGYESSLMMLFAVAFMFLYCLMTDGNSAFSFLKHIASLFTGKAYVKKGPSKEYPFAVFMAAGYPLALLLNTGRII